MLSRHLWLQRPVALQTMSEGLEKKKKKKKKCRVEGSGFGVYKLIVILALVSSLTLGQ